MSTNPWVIPLTGVLAAGDVKQLYPDYMAPGVAKAGSTAGQLLRRPMEGACHSIQLKTDGTEGGTLEMYDINGEDIGADVSSLDVITNAQLTALLANGRAKLIFTQNFVGTAGSGVINAPGIYRAFARGLGARFVSDATPAEGDAVLNLVIEGGARYTDSLGGY